MYSHIHKEWFLGAGFLGAPPMSLRSDYVLIVLHLLRLDHIYIHISTYYVYIYIDYVYIYIYIYIYHFSQRVRDRKMARKWGTHRPGHCLLVELMLGI